MGFMDKFKQPSSGMGMPTQDDMATMNKLTRLNDVGVEHPATINSLSPTGKTDVGGGVEYQIAVTVSPEGGAPYEATFNQSMHQGSMGSWATEGAAVKVRVDPEDPNSMILWGGAG